MGGVEQYPIVKSYRQVPVERVRMDSEYQRQPKPEFVRELVRGWEPLLAGVLVVSHRGNALWCLDGGHRVAAMRELGVEYADATVLQNLSQVDEASLFIRFNKNRRNMTVLDLFRAQVTARDPVALGVQHDVYSRGLTMGQGPDYDIQAVGALMRVYEMGPDLLGEVLDLIVTNWTVDKNRFYGTVLHALAHFIKSYRPHPNYDRARLAQVMVNTSPSTLNRLAQEIIAERGSVQSTGHTTVTEAIRLTYNTRLSPAKQLPSHRVETGE